MLLQGASIAHIHAIAHEGKVLVIATDTTGRLSYTVKQDGFEDSFLSTPADRRTGWEAWQPLELPNEEADRSVLEREQAEFTEKDAPDSYILRSIYKSQDLGAPAPVQLLSAMGHLYVFRPSSAGTLLVDRFVLDGMTNRLTRKLEVRFKRSRQRYKPSEEMKQSVSGLQSLDSLDYRDTAGASFYEPTTELCLVRGVQSGWFSVVLVPTSEQECYRWHIAAFNQGTKKVELISLRASPEGLFDVKDHTLLEPASAQDPTLRPRSIPGIIRRTLELGGAQVTAGFCATRYDLQQERAVAGDSQKQLVRTETRLMLALPTDQGTIALSFALAADGTLSQIGADAETKILRSRERGLLLPLNELELVKAAGDVTAPARGSITGVRSSTADDGGVGQVVLSVSGAEVLSDGDTVQVLQTSAQDGLYKVSGVEGDSFTIETAATRSELGRWERQEAKEGVIFDEMLTGYSLTPDGRLEITAPNHGLLSGDEVQIVGTAAQDGTFPIRKIDDGQFVLERKWSASEAKNVKLVSRKRRGLVLDGVDDQVVLPPQSLPTGGELTVSFWAKDGQGVPRYTVLLEAMDTTGQRLLNLHLPWADNRVYFDCAGDRIERGVDPSEYAKGEWVHWALTKDAARGEMKIFRNGALWHSGKGSRPLGKAAYLVIGRSRATGNTWDGTLAELRIFSRALGEQEIRSQMYLTLGGQEPGLVGSWRLGAVLEDKERTVVDSSKNGLSGTVLGGASAGAVMLDRTLRSGAPAAKYTNSELVAVSQRSSYKEEFEFKVNAATPLSLAQLDGADGTNRKLFVISCWGKRSRSAEEVVPIPVVQSAFQELGSGWYRVRGEFTIPDGVSLVRTFEIADVRGSWQSLELRNHSLCTLSDRISEARYTDSVTPAALVDSYGELAGPLGQLAIKEQAEAALLKEKRELEVKLALLASSTELRARQKALDAELPELQKAEQALRGAYDQEVANPLNYVCEVECAGMTGQFMHMEFGSWRVVLASRTSYSSDQLWEFYLQADGSYCVRSSGQGVYAAPVSESGKYALKRSTASVLSSSERFKIQRSSSGDYSIESVALAGQRAQGVQDGSRRVVQLQKSGSTDAQRWRIRRNGSAVVINQAAIDRANTAWQEKLREVGAKQKELDELNALLKADEAEQKKWQARLSQVGAQLDALLSEMLTLNGTFLSGLAKVKTAAQEMPVVATDARKLVTRGARLPFVRPASRLHAMETCEGNVQLCYFDERGRLRQTVYDAAADSRSTTYEQWIPDAPRACLRFEAGKSVLRLTRPIELPGEWSVEAWLMYPPPQREWNTLLCSGDELDQPLVLYQGRYLGARVQGLFLSSGYSLERLVPGWHHVSAVRRQPDTDQAGSIGFYVDGEAVGEVALPIAALSFDGQDDQVELPAASLAGEKQLSICFWAREDAAPSDSAVVLEAVDAKGQRLVAISLAGRKGKVTFECGLADGSLDRAEKKGAELPATPQWTHWAFTKNTAGAVMRIYRNGVLWHSISQKRKALSAATKLVLGRAVQGGSAYKGQIAELSIWSRELSETELQAQLGRARSGSESGLSGAWRFEDKQAVDALGSKGASAYAGGLQAVRVPPAAAPPIQLVAIGNSLTESEREEEGIVPVTSLLLDGKDDYVEMPVGCLPTGGQISVSLWARNLRYPLGYSSVLSALGGGGRVLNIHLPWVDGSVYFDCGDERIVKPLPTGQWTGVWTHWVFTKNTSTGEMSIFCDGELWHSEKGKTRPLAAATRFEVGRACDQIDHVFNGEIAELSTWDRALTATEVKALKGKLLSGSEDGLCGYWRLEGSQLRDLSPRGNHGTLRGGPVGGSTMQLKGRVKMTALATPAGKVAEVRVWGAALSADEVRVNSRTLLCGNEPGLLAYLPLGEGTGSEARDLAGSERKGQAQGAAWWACAAPIGNPGHASLSLDGKGGCVSSAAGLLSGLGRFTLEAWVKVRAITDRTVSFFGQNDAVEFGLQGQELVAWAPGGSVNTGVKFPLGEWHHVAVVGDGGMLTLYQDGARVGSGGARSAPGSSGEPFTLGAGVWSGGTQHPLDGQLAEVRVWRCARTAAQLRESMSARLSGQEPELIGYWPLDRISGDGTTLSTPDLSSGKRPGKVTGGQILIDNTLPLSGSAAVSVEYSTIRIDPATQRKAAMMRRLFAAPAQGGALLLPDKRIEDLALQWIGNGQFAPTLLGYIEGAPPVPSENLTVEATYNGATAVELAMSEDVEFRWSRSQDSGLGLDVDLFAGVDTEAFAGLGAMTKAADIRAGVKGGASLSYQYLNESNITTSSSQRMTDRLELRGTTEQTPKFPHLGPRFVPKNVGYALVISSLADVYVTKLARSGRMVGYELQPVDGVPPDVNTITFLMNPAYVMQGSLDGMTGSSATSERFHKHVPEMRAQYGSLYPVSYYRLQEAYDLKRQIESDDKRRESFFAQFNVRLLDEGAMSQQVQGGAEATPVGVNRDGQAALSREEQEKADRAQQQELSLDAGQSSEAQSDAVQKRRAEISQHIADQEKRAHAAECFTAWQRRMEDLAIKAGKRNIVNTYVWDADGGLRTESQSFASTAEHTIGGSFTLDANLGFEGQFGAFGAKVELTALATANLTQTLSKTEARSKGIELTVDLSGVESSGITDHNDLPIQPGEKVDRYRFMSFYLEGSSRNFNDFFSYVVDPEWLQSNDEEARALRQAQGKANKTWRVMHRVTYVERPALAGYGRDVRTAQSEDALTAAIVGYFQELAHKQQVLEQKVNQLDARLAEILSLLRKDK